MLNMPRFRVNAIESDGLWGFEMLITVIGDGEDGDLYEHKPIFKTKEDALAEARRAIADVCQNLAKESGGELAETYIDFNANKQRRWDSKDLN